MTREFFATRARHVLIATAAALVGGSIAPAMAQEPIAAVTVVAPHAVHRQAGTAFGGIALFELVSLTRQVGYGDLDLSTPAGVTTFENRISDTAKQACAQLDALYPPSRDYMPDPANEDCAKKATADALARAKLVIAAAGK